MKKQCVYIYLEAYAIPLFLIQFQHAALSIVLGKPIAYKSNLVHGNYKGPFVCLCLSPTLQPVLVHLHPP